MVKEYGNDSIRSLTDRQAVRLRPSNYLGSDDIRGAFHSLNEIFSNGCDEFKATGFSEAIIVTRHDDDSLSVQDFGRGVPVDWNTAENKFNYELIFERLNAGGKYDNDSYEYSLGLNGLGASVTQFTSEWMVVKSVRDGFIYTINFEKGSSVGELQKVKNIDNLPNGTFVKWKPDLEEVFTDIDIPYTWIVEYLDKQTLVNKGLKVKYIDKKEDKTFDFCYENGIVDYVKKISNGKELSSIVYKEKEDIGREREDKEEYKVKLQIAFCFNNVNAFIDYYHNSSWLKHGGSPYHAVKNSFLYVINKYIKDNNKYNKNEKEIKFEDIEDCLILVSNTYSTYTSYEHQTKVAINNKFIKECMTSWLKEELEIYLMENKMEAEKIVEQVLINKRSREKSETTRIDIRKKLESTNKSKLGVSIEGLTDCDKTIPLEDREIWLGEGDSAVSTLTNARDNITMATYPLRGRFINSIKASVVDVLNNKVAFGLVQALGCGVDIPKEERKMFKDIDSFDENSLQYGRIMIACDADSWGRGITLSLICFFWKFMRKLIEQKRVFVSISPRYEIREGDNLHFAYNEQDKEKIVKELTEQKKKFTVGIVKGLGELDSDVFWDYVMNPETRIVKQISCDGLDEEDIEYYINTLMGDDIDERKKYVRKHIIDAIKIEELD